MALGNEHGHSLCEACERSNAPRSLTVMSAIHRARCHESVFSTRVQQLLDQRYRDKRQEVALLFLCDLVALARSDLAQVNMEIPGLLWALLRDPRPCCEAVERLLVWRMQTEGIRSLTFGKVELVAVLQLGFLGSPCLSCMIPYA